MSSRLVAFGFASVLLLISGAPAFANDTAIIQNAESETIITGNDNTVRNETEQTSDNNRRRSGNTGVSQSVRSNTDIQGDGNRVNKRTRQRSENVNQ
ncbi:hypothetical protein [Chamaesiphon polymorphus]|uniref:Uncharacterized protein n=1 Tax=Chamaesiphon polymorphus CCALA 037 TaxID=2107692 RepID=A0A2T1GFN6_9CYAN|nr:hypothetical protein [Chamaesiphon polymorphus]PSB56415.1 hypothetical protein C7B77_11955 [Chamaesiphon polymorphus CCALA 037]